MGICNSCVRAGIGEVLSELRVVDFFIVESISEIMERVLVMFCIRVELSLMENCCFRAAI